MHCYRYVFHTHTHTHKQTHTTLNLTIAQFRPHFLIVNLKALKMLQTIKYVSTHEIFQFSIKK